MIIFERIEAALTGLNIPMGQGEYQTSSGVPLPDQYLVFSEIDEVAAQHADNGEKARRYRMQINFYSRGGIAEADKANIVTAMLAAGFTRGPGRGLPYVPGTRHYGLGMDFYFAEE